MQLKFFCTDHVMNFSLFSGVTLSLASSFTSPFLTGRCSTSCTVFSFSSSFFSIATVDCAVSPCSIYCFLNCLILGNYFYDVFNLLPAFFDYNQFSTHSSLCSGKHGEDHTDLPLPPCAGIKGVIHVSTLIFLLNDIVLALTRPIWDFSRISLCMVSSSLSGHFTAVRSS